MDCFNMEGKGKVHAVAEEIRQLNGLDEKTLFVRYGSWHEIVYAGNIKKLTLPEGYWVSTYNERGKIMPSITNEGNTGTNAYWTFTVSQR